MTAETHRLTLSEEEVLRLRARSLAFEGVEEEIGEVTSMLLFKLGAEWYGVPVHDVREIHREYRVTPIPCVPEHVLGVVSIRGEVISVVDMAVLLHLSSSRARDRQPPAVVIDGQGVELAMVVDEIGEIADIPVESIEPPIGALDRQQVSFVGGTAQVGERLVGLIDVGRVLEPVGGPTGA